MSVDTAFHGDKNSTSVSTGEKQHIHQQRVTDLALTALPSIDQDIIGRFEAHFVAEESRDVHGEYIIGPQDGYALSPSGLQLSQKEFGVAYLHAAGKICEAARALISAGYSEKDLTKMRAELRAELRQLPNSTLIPDRDQWQRTQENYEQAIRTELVRLAAADPEDKQLRFRAINYALLQLGIAERKVETEELLDQGGRARLEEYRTMMQAARRSSPSGATAVEVLGNFMEIVKERHGYSPRLCVLNDFDGNLTISPESGSPWKPGEKTNRLIGAIDQLAKLPLSLRLATTECPGTDVERVALAKQLYAIAAVQSEFFSDAPALIRKLGSDKSASQGISQVVLTANHSRLVKEKLRQHGFPHTQVVGPSESHGYTNKADWLLHRALKEPMFSVFIMSDDRDRPLAQHIGAIDPEHAEQFGVDIPLSDFMFFSARQRDKIIENAAIHDRLEQHQIPHVVNAYDKEKGTGLTGLRRFVNYYLQEKRDADNGYISIGVPSNREDYRPGMIIDRCRRRMALSPHIPKPQTIVSAIRPEQRFDLIGTRPNLQFDLGACTGVPIPQTNRWLLLFKAANGPSSRNPALAKYGKIGFESVSNVYAAVYDFGTGQVWYLDKEGVKPRDQVKPLFTTSVPEIAASGLHDPRATYIPELNKILVTACAFDKIVERQSKSAAAGQADQPMLGAYTELFSINGVEGLAKDIPEMPATQAYGFFGPDKLHFKNMVFFPELFHEKTGDRLYLLVRRFPDIQILPVPIKQLQRITGAPENRELYWETSLSQHSLAKLTAMRPRLAHEGFKNPYAQIRTGGRYGAGQLAPGAPPVRVDASIDGKGRPCWLVLYNSVPDNGPNNDAIGRAICAALLDYKNPYRLLARAPLPLLLPRRDEEVLKEDDVQVRTRDIAFVGGCGQDASGRFGIVFTEGDSIVRLGLYGSADEIAAYVARHDRAGRILDPRRFPRFEDSGSGI